jgi:drug/metabolite transporter (DMT)-like permease
MLTITDGLLLAGLAFLGAAAQLCLKRGADLGRPGHFVQSLFRPWVVTGVALMATNMLVIIWILRRLPLTSVMPITALIYALVPMGASLFFGEKLRPKFWLGAFLIMAGIIMSAA